MDVFFMAGFATELTEMTGIEVSLSAHNCQHLTFKDVAGMTGTMEIQDNKMLLIKRRRCGFEVPLADPNAIERIAEGIKECYASPQCKGCRMRIQDV
jgi:hypothetical protein